MEDEQHRILHHIRGEAYGAGIGQAGKLGHSGMAEDLRLAQVQLGG